MGVLLVIGLLVAALRWIERPALGWALLGGVFAGAIILTHGIEVYSSVLVLAVLALARFRRILAPGRIGLHLPLALGLAILIATPYLPTLLGWAGTGGAISAGEAFTATTDSGQADWLQFALGISGAASLIDLPLRFGLIALGLSMQRRVRLAAVLWMAFVALLLLVQFVDVPPMRTLLVVTFPWLA